MRLVELSLVVPFAPQKCKVTFDLLGWAPVAMHIDMFVGLTAKLALNIKIIGKSLESYITWKSHVSPPARGANIYFAFTRALTTQEGRAAGGRATVAHYFVANDASKIGVIGHVLLHVLGRRIFFGEFCDMTTVRFVGYFESLW